MEGGGGRGRGAVTTVVREMMLHEKKCTYDGQHPSGHGVCVVA